MWLFILIAFVLAGRGNLSAAEPVVNFQDPTVVLQTYLRATYARDYIDAYRFISSADRKVRDLNRYAQQRGPFAGFTLELARKLSESMEIKFKQRQDDYN